MTHELRVILISALLAILPTAFAAAEESSVPIHQGMEFGRDLAWLAGTWVGTGYQPTESVRTFSIKVVINAAKDIYQSQYSSIPCNGKWSLLSSDGCQARFHETISAGDCRPGTVIVTQLIFAGTMSRYITWTRYLENGTLDAWATLKKN